MTTCTVQAKYRRGSDKLRSDFVHSVIKLSVTNILAVMAYSVFHLMRPDNFTRNGGQMYELPCLSDNIDLR